MFSYPFQIDDYVEEDSLYQVRFVYEKKNFLKMTVKYHHQLMSIKKRFNEVQGYKIFLNKYLLLVVFLSVGKAKFSDEIFVECFSLSIF